MKKLQLLIFALLAALGWGQNVIVVKHKAAAPGPLRRSITIDHTKVPNTDQQNFPLLVSGTYPFLATVANGGDVQHTVAQPLYSLVVPADVKFTSDSAGANLLNWEYESYDAATGACAIWVEIPTLSHTGDTVIYLWYGDTSVTDWQGGAKGSVWNEAYSAVWHMADNAASTTVVDATANGRDATNADSTSIKRASGQIGGALTFNGSSDGMVFSSAAINLDSGTMQVWLNPAFDPVEPYSTFHYFFDSDDARHSFYKASTEVWPQHSINMYNDGRQTAHDVSGLWTAGEWHLFAFVYEKNGAVQNLFIDGQQVADAAPGGSWGTTPLGANGYFGRRFSNTELLAGVADEVRISNLVRSADWIQAEFNNQSSPYNFYTVSAPF